MKDNAHIQELAGDYVLDLLDDDTRATVESHLAHCAACRDAVLAERRMAQLFGRTVAQASDAPAAIAPVNPRHPVPWAPAARRARRRRWQNVYALTLLSLLLFSGFTSLRPSAVDAAVTPAVVAVTPAYIGPANVTAMDGTAAPTRPTATRSAEAAWRSLELTPDPQPRR